MISIDTMNFANFDLNLLRVLDALLDTCSTTEASARVGLSQPAVSAALSRLRHALNDPLFVRQGRRLVPTDYAAGLQTPLREILGRTEALLSSPDPFDPSRSNARLTLSGSDFYAEMLMPVLADHLSRHAPRMRVQLVDLVPDNYAQSLENQSVDMAILPRTQVPNWVETRLLHRSAFVVVARAGHPSLAHAGLSDGALFPLDLFCALQHVLFSPEGKLEGLGDAALARLGRQRRVAMTLPVFSGVLNAVSQSDLIALVPHQLAEHAARRLNLALYREPVGMGTVELVLAWHRRKSHGGPHQWLREQIAMLTRPLNRPPTFGKGSGQDETNTGPEQSA
ncbi:LysR family transcriptional regulator [Cribrihabitans sp. XS_ASV171]